MNASLTQQGQDYAIQKAYEGSMVAKVALAGTESGWPQNFVASAIRTMNTEAKST